MEAAQTERRRFSRVNFDGEAQLIQGGHAHPVHILDLSVKGVLAKADSTLRPDTQAATLAIALANGTAIEMTVELIHSDAQTLGFRCISIDVDSAAHLRRLIELNLNSPDAAERVLEELLQQPAEPSATTPSEN